MHQIGVVSPNPKLYIGYRLSGLLLPLATRCWLVTQAAHCRYADVMSFGDRVPSWLPACSGSHRPRTDTVYDGWGPLWELEITKAIDKADFIVICISRRSITKRGFVQREIKLAIDTYQAMPSGEAFLMPARLEDCTVPQELSRYQYCDLFTENGLKLLVDAILTHWAKRIKERGDKV
jgi:hypothetical protein